MSCSFYLSYVIFVVCLFISIVKSHFRLQGGTLNLIASVPGHCFLPFIFLFGIKCVLTNEWHKGFSAKRNVEFFSCLLNLLISIADTKILLNS